MGEFIGFAILFAILIIVISKLIKKTREVRESFRDTFGGGRDQTIENATNMLLSHAKGAYVPEWAVTDAARELTKYNVTESQLDAENILRKFLRDHNTTTIDIPKDMTLTSHQSAESVKATVRIMLEKLNAKHYKEKGGFSSKDLKYIENCKTAYFFAVDGVSMQEAAAAVDYLVDEWKAKYDDVKLD